MKRFGQFLAGLGLMFHVGCQQEVVLPQLPYDERVVIQGVVEPDSVPVVYLNRTVPYLSGTTDPADLVLRQADVLVYTVDSEDHLKLDSTFLPMDCKYTYYYRGSIPVKRNTTYTLVIHHEGKTYSAYTTTSLQPVVIDKVDYTPAFKDIYGEHEGVITWFQDLPEAGNYYRFEMTRDIDQSTRYVTGNGRDLLVPCLEEGDTVSYVEYGRSVYNDENLQGQQVKLVVEPGLTHFVKVKISVRIQTIDKATYDFYELLDGQKLGQYNPFIEPVYIQTDQFGDAAVGYFGSLVRSDPVAFEMPPDD